MTVSIKIKYDYLKLVCELFDFVTSSEEHLQNVQFTKEFRANFSIVSGVIIKFKKKLLDKEGVEVFKISFKDYEGYYLSKFIYENSPKLYLGDIYEQTVMDSFYKLIDENL